MQLAQVEIHKEAFSFSAGHFTIFSATEREALHGHNYHVSISFKVKIEHNGLAFDYRCYKKKIAQLCDSIDRRTLLPSKSTYLKLTENESYYVAHFNQQILYFLKEDVVILPLTNITIEELARWFLEDIVKDKESLLKDGIQSMHVKVYNGPMQSGGASWQQQ